MALIVAVGVLAALAARGTQQLFRHQEGDKEIQWQYLEGVEGTNLQRLEVPNGWIVEGADGYLVVVVDVDKQWLEEDPEE